MLCATQRVIAGVAFCVLIALATRPCSAIPIRFIHTGSGSGSINGVPFGTTAPVRFTITETGDTSNRAPFIVDGFYINDLTAAISIDNVGTFNFVSGTRTFVNNTLSIVGFSRPGAFGSDLFNGPTSGLFHTWNMLSSIGPISGNGQLLQWTAADETVLTSGGVLRFNNGIAPATFQAQLIPEPMTAGLSLMGLGAVALGLRRRR